MEFRVADLSVGRTYKMLVSCVVPRPIAFVTSVGRSGVLNAAPFSYFNMMGHNPPVVAIGVGDRTPGVPNNIGEAREFVVNLVDEALGDKMVQCATDFPADESEIERVGLTTSDAVTVDVPRIAESPVHLECREASTVSIGRTRVILGEVIHFAVRDELLEEVSPGRWHVRTADAHFIGRMHGRNNYTRTRDLIVHERTDYETWLKQHDQD